MGVLQDVAVETSLIHFVRNYKMINFLCMEDCAFAYKSKPLRFLWSFEVSQTPFFS